MRHRTKMVVFPCEKGYLMSIPEISIHYNFLVCHEVCFKSFSAQNGGAKIIPLMKVIK